jgi:hypothetical protein
MNEREFILQLQERAREQEQAITKIPFFSFIAKWLSVHPWRYLIPLAFLVSLIFRGILGSSYTDFILGLFKGL